MAELRKKWLSRALCAALAVTLVSGMTVMSPVSCIAGISTGITASAADDAISSGDGWKVYDLGNNECEVVLEGTLTGRYGSGGTKIRVSGYNPYGFSLPEGYKIVKISAAEGTKFVGVCTSMFSSNYSVREIDLSNVDTSGVTDMSMMFGECYALTSIDLSSWNTSAVKDMGGMFRFDSALKEINLSGSFDMSAVTRFGSMFSGCNVEKLIVNDKFIASYDGNDGVPVSDYNSFLANKSNGKKFDDGWVNAANPDVVISGNGNYAAISGQSGTLIRKTIPYTVTWKNDDDTELETDENVVYGTAPSYDKATPTKAEDAEYTYTFSGWTDGTNTYGVNDTLPAVAGDVTYTAVFEGTKRSYNVTWKNDDGSVIDTTSVEYGETPTHAEPTKEETTLYTYRFTGWTPDITDVTGDTEYTATFEEIEKPLFAAHSVTLSGDMGVNFFVDPAVVGADVEASERAVVKFTWDNGTKVSEVNLKEIEPESNGWYKAACTVPVAYMAHTIHAEVYINGVKQDEENDYSVQDYVSAVLEDPSKFDSDKPEELAELVKEMINYGKMAQAVFSGQMGSQAEYNEIEGYTMADVTADMIQNEIDKNPANIGKTATDITTVKPEVGAKYYTSSLIFLSESTLRHYFVVPNGSADTSMYDGCKSDRLCYVEKTGISASQLDDLQEFKVGGVTFYYSALDYAKAVIGSDKMSADQKNLAKALFLYNRAANNYFPIDLSTLGGNYEAQDGDWFTNTLSADKVLTVAENATITLIDSDITSQSAGITPLGDATIIIKGENVVRGGTYSPGIIAAAGHTITIDGTGSLETYGGYLGAGIGISQGESGGEIVINGGTVKATGSGNAAGIGGGQRGSGGEITINGGTITAIGGSAAAGIGCGTSGSGGNITINGGNITATGNSNAGAGIGSAFLGSCGNIIINGGTVKATGGQGSSGIGGAYNGSCGDITINNTVTKVTAQRGGYSPSTIGKGYGSSTCGTVTIGGNVVTTGTSPNPYVYEP